MKWIGLIMVSLTLCLVGIKERNRYKKETLFWKEMEGIASFFTNELRYTCDEPVKIFSRYLLQSQGEVKKYSSSFPQLFGEFVLEKFGQRQPDEKIEQFIGGLGVTDLEGQLAHCGRYQRMFLAQYEQSVTEYKVQGSLRQKLWMLSAVALFLMFI